MNLTGVPNIFINLFRSSVNCLQRIRDTTGNAVRIYPADKENEIIRGSNSTTKHFNTNYIWRVFANKVGI